MATQKLPHITDTELEILGHLWQRKAATVKEIHELLTEEKETGYTTTLKQMQLMLDKGLLARDDSQRQHIYKPAVARQKVQRRFMDRMLRVLFNDSATEFVLQALGNYKTSEAELEQINALIEKAKKQPK